MAGDEPGTHVIDAAEVRHRFDQVRERVVDAGGDLDAITIVAVTKGFGADAIRVAVDAGLTDIGESYAQELVHKSAVLADELEWPRVHFIGHLQRNKIRALVDRVDLWQSIDRESVAVELAKRSPGAQVLLQLNVSGAESQGGCPLGQAPVLLGQMKELGLDVRGCMAIGAQGAPEVVRASFDDVRVFADEFDLEVRSMGMSGDLEHAVAAGATMVRIGTQLMGERPPR